MAIPHPVLDSDSLKSGEVYVASNRRKAIVFQNADETNRPSITSPPCEKELERLCVSYGTYWPYVFRAYYIRDTDPLDNKPPTLSRKTLQWDVVTGMSIVTEDLVEGVEGMRVLYSDRPPSAWPASQTKSNRELVPFKNAAAKNIEWANHSISAVRIHLLVRSLEPDRSHEDDSKYTLGDTVVDLATASFATSLSQGAQLRNFHRIVVSATATIRNKNLPNPAGSDP
jgi:hypothetical protein